MAIEARKQAKIEAKEKAKQEAEEARKAKEAEIEARKQAEIEAKEKAKREVEEARKAKEAEENRPPTQAEKIATERERLERIISDLEKQPLQYFGSQKNKRVRIGYYRYRLEALQQDPDKYFKNPENFEGNVKENDKIDR